MLNSPVFIIGFMAAGKTIAAKKASEYFDIKFIDSDQSIEKEKNITIQEIFKQDGENTFRTIEKEWLVDHDFTNCIISLGGGFPCYNNQMEKLLETGTVIFLNTDWETIENRLIKDKERPLNKSINDIKSLYDSRLSTYNKAHYIIKTEKELIELISKLIKK